MEEQLRILNLEDEASITDVVKAILTADGFTPTIVRVETRAQFEKEIGKDNYDIILADYRLPDFDGIAALKIAREKAPLVPFIFFSGSLGEELAIESLRNGATDYVLKNKPNRLASAVRRALRERRERVEREAVQRKLQESELKFRSIFESAHDAIILTDENGNIISWNRGAELIFDYRTDEIIGKSLALIIPREYRRLHQQGLQRFLKTGEAHVIGKTVEIKGVKKNGSKFPVELSLSHWETGGQVYFSAIIRDISERKAAEERIHASEERYRTLVETILDGIVIADLDENFLFVNKAFCDMVGYRQEELLKMNVLDLVPEDEIPHILEHTRKRIEGVSSIYETRLRSHSGEERLFLVSGSPHKNPTSDQIETLAVFHDITQRKQSEEEIKRAYRETEQLVSAISSILIKIDERDHITRWNCIAEEVFGIPADEVLGKPFINCGIQWDWEQIIEQISRSRQDEKTTIWEDVRYTRPDGKPGFLRISVNPVFNEKKKNVGFLFLMSEITDRKNLESQLSQVQKLESIGQLAAGIAHEINTPTQFVGDNIHFLKDSVQDIGRLLNEYDALIQNLKGGQALNGRLEKIEQLKEEIDLEYLVEEIPSAIEQSIEGVQRVSKIVSAMKEFSHPGIEEKVPVDINKALENTIMVSRNEWKYVAEIETDFAEALPLVSCLPGELNQVFLNIIINAAHAIGDTLDQDNSKKGKITIRTRKVGKWVEVLISDNGTGIPRYAQSKIFDPFFTTKEVGKGTGQGLAISHNVIVTKHHGTLTFDTEEGKGTTFKIRLPISDEPQ